jgi:hypothetical protein
MLHDVFQITCCVHYAVDIALVMSTLSCVCDTVH